MWDTVMIIEKQKITKKNNETKKIRQMLKEYSTMAQLKPLSIPLKANQVNLPSSVKTHKVFFTWFI